MAQDRKLEAPKLGFELNPKPEVLRKYFNHAMNIPLIHLAKQFINPGIPDAKGEMKDEKRVAKTNEIVDFDNFYPHLTRAEAYNRLILRLSNYNFSDQTHVDFIFLIKNLSDQKEPSAFERIILGIAHENGLGTEIDLKKAFEYYKSVADELFNLNLNKHDFSITYHRAMASNDMKVLQGQLSNDPVNFNKLWCEDIDSKFLLIKKQALQRTQEIVPHDNKKLIHEAHPRLRANLAIQNFEKQNFEHALIYLEGLGVKSLTPEENYKIGFWLHSLSRTEEAPLIRHGLLAQEDSAIEEKLFGKRLNSPLFQQSLSFLKEAASKDHKEAKNFLAKIVSDSVSPLTSNSLFPPPDYVGSKGAAAAAATTNGIKVSSLDDDEDPNSSKTFKKIKPPG